MFDHERTRSSRACAVPWFYWATSRPDELPDLVLVTLWDPIIYLPLHTAALQPRTWHTWHTSSLDNEHMKL